MIWLAQYLFLAHLAALNGDYEGEFTGEDDWLIRDPNQLGEAASPDVLTAIDTSLGTPWTPMMSPWLGWSATRKAA